MLREETIGRIEDLLRMPLFKMGFLEFFRKMQEEGIVAAKRYWDAIDLLGPTLGLPKAVGGHQSYWLWGPRQYTGECVIVLGDELEDSARHFETCTVAAELNNPYARPQERLPVLLCRKLKYDLREVWPQLKEWD